VDRLAELNVIEQVVHVARTTIVQEAWQRRQPLTLHGFIYGLTDGLLNDLAIELRGLERLDEVHAAAVARLGSRR